LSVDLTIFPELPNATKILLPKETPDRIFVVGEVALSQDDPLSVDLTMVPEIPTATKVSLSKATPLRRFAVGEVTLSKEDPLSADLTIFPESPTPTNIAESEEESEDEESSEELSEDEERVKVPLEHGEVLSACRILSKSVVAGGQSAHEEIITVILNIDTNQSNIFFILFFRKC
tara:strand:+ start:92 stop:616 length:525 start_codon:yes stop_codon:yes gene_type:complete